MKDRSENFVIFISAVFIFPDRNMGDRDKCYKCQKPGHFARECHADGVVNGGGRGGRGGFRQGGFGGRRNGTFVIDFAI